MSYLTGQQIEQYQVEALLGEGGMGVVYQAVDLNRQQPVALKVMHANLALQPAFRRRFEQEAEVVMPFNHPAIIRIYERGERLIGESSVPFMVMEYIAGGSLSAYLQQLQWAGNQILLQEALTIVAQIADGLSYAHHRGLVHRDIKPGNILLKRERGFSGEVEQAVISDFGLAIVMPSATQGGSGEDVATNPFMGSLPYMSPEQCSNLPLDGRSDIYSLGIMLYRMATGQLPFKIEAPADVVKHLNEPPLPPALLNPDIPEAVETLILKAIAKKPAERYQSGAEMAHAARQAVNAVRASRNGENRPAHPITQWVDEQWIARINVNDRVDVHQTWTSEGEHRLFVTHQWEPSQLFSLDKETITIGRAADNDVVLEDGAVSNHHLTLIRTKEGGWLARDAGSTNGSFLDGHRLPYDEEVIWNHEQTLRLGPYFLKWQAFQSHVRQAGGAALPFAAEGPHTPPQPSDSEAATGTVPLAHEPESASNGQQSNGHDNGYLLAASLPEIPPPQIKSGNGAPIAPLPPAAEPQAVTEGDGALGLALTPAEVEVEPGSETYAQLTILNQGTTVEDISVRVEQRDQSSIWITALEPALKLMPDESKAVTLLISPPLGDDGHNGAPPEAGIHPYNIVVTTSRGERAVIAGTVEVARLESTVLDMHPRNLQEGITCRLTVQNRSNFPNRYQLMGIDDSDALQFTFDQPQNVLRTDEENGFLWITVPVGGEARIPFKVGAKKRPWLRQPTTPYPFQVRVRSEATDWSNMEGQLSVRPRISRRSLIAILLILLFLSLLGFLIVREMDARNQEELQRVQATSDAIRATADALEATRVALQSGVDSKILEAEALEAKAQALEANDPEQARNIRATASALREEAGAVQATINALQGDLDKTEAELAEAQRAANVTPTPPPPPTDIILDNLSVPEDAGIGTTIGSFSAITGSDSSTVGQSDDARFAVLGKGRSAVPAQQIGPRITFSLVDGNGGDDNSAFYIEGNMLKVGAALDYETKTSYSIRVQADNDAGGVFAKSFTILIIDVDDTPTLTIRNVTVDEGDGSVVITVEMSGNTQSEVAVDYETSDGTARAGRDYEETRGTVTWKPETTGPQTFRVPLIDDKLDEPDETFYVTLSNPKIAIINNGTAIVTIVDDDDEPTLSVSDVTVEEGEKATVTVVLDGLSSQEVVVDYQTANGTAKDGEDYDSASGTLRWEAGKDGELTFTVTTEDDDIHEANETIKVTLSGARNARINQGTANITITDNDDPPTLAIESMGPVQEGGEAALTVMMTGRSATEVSVKYATSDGTARAGRDYQATTGTLTWAPGETGARFIRVTIHADNIYEAPDETFKVIISNAVNATITQEEATFTITDDDQKPSLAILDATVNEKDGTATVIVRMTGASSTAVRANYTSGDGTAKAGEDYEPVSSPPELTWLPEDNSERQIKVNIRDDDIDEGASEYFEISLSVASDNATIADGIAVVTIVDDDEAGFVVTPASLSVTEGEGAEQFTLRLSSQPAAEVVVPFTVNNQCFIGNQGSHTIEARLNESNWKSGVNINVFANDDDIDDGDRSCNLRAGDPRSDDLQYDKMDATDIPSISVIAIDDDIAGIEVNPTTLEISEPDDIISFTINLTSEPLDTVTIPLSSSDTTECRVQQSSVEIAPAEWKAGKTIEVRAVDDDVDDDDQPCTIITGDPKSGDPIYEAFRSSDVENVAVTVRDDDHAGVTISPPTLTISETAGADQATISVTLTSEPVWPVTIPVSNQDSIECSVSPATLTFTSANWNTTQKVTVKAVDDKRHDGAQPCDIKLGPAQSTNDAKYNNMGLSDVSVTVLDDDVPGITLRESGMGTVVGEDGSQDEYTIVLETEPFNPVEITIHPDSRLDVGKGPGQPVSVTFSALTWHVPHTVTVSALDDDIDDDDVTVVITHTASSSDSHYNGSKAPFRPSSSIDATIIDDDEAGIEILQTDNYTMTVQEGGPLEGGPDKYAIVLTSQPTDDVVVVITPHSELDVGNGYGVSVTLTITPTIWNIPQEIPVLVQDDDIYEPDHPTQTITHTVSSDDPKYHNIAVPDVVVEIEDDEDPPLITAENITITEGDRRDVVTATMTVTLIGQTTQPASVSYTTSDGTAKHGTDYDQISPAQQLNWAVGDSGTQTIELTIYGDDIDEPDEEFYVVFANVQNAKMDVYTYTVTIIDDDDAPTITIDDITVEEGDTGWQKHTVTLEMKGLSSEAITVSYKTRDGSAIKNSDYAPLDKTVTWPAEQEGTQTFTIEIKGDKIDEGIAEHFFIDFEVESNRATLLKSTATVTILDNDWAEIDIEPPSLTFTESMSTTYQLKLDKEPVLDVSVVITPESPLDLGNGAGKAITRTLTPDQWSTPAVITVTVPDDDIAQGIRTFYIQHLATSSDPDYGSTEIPFSPRAELEVRVEDDDSPGLEINPPNFAPTIKEGESSTFQLRLTSEPTATVTVRLSVNKQLDLTQGAGEPLVLTFTPSTWDTFQTVKVIAFDDKLYDGGDHIAEIKYEITSEDGGYDGLNIPPLQVTIEDAESEPVLSANNVTVDEFDGPATITVTTSGASSMLISVDYTTSNGTATAPDDYQGTSGTLIWLAGDSDSKTITVPIVDDNIDESNETIDIEFSNVTNASMPTTLRTITILDDDPIPSLSIADHRVREGEPGAARKTHITVTLSHPSSQQVSVEYDVKYGTADFADIFLHPGPLTWNPGEDGDKFIEVDILGDTIAEDDEYFDLILHNPSNAEILKESGRVTIIGDQGGGGALPNRGLVQSPPANGKRLPPGLAPLSVLFLAGLPLTRRRSRWRQWLLLALLMVGLLALQPAVLAQGTPEVRVDHVETVEGSDSLGLNIYFTIDSGGQSLAAPSDIESAAVLLDGDPTRDGVRYPATVEKPPFYVALMVDTSGSMGGTLDVTRQAALDLIAAAPPEVSFAVLGFDEAINLIQPFTTDRQQVTAALNSIEISNRGTCLYDAAYAAVQSLEQLSRDAPRRALVLFSDGRDEPGGGQCSQNSPEQLTGLFQARSVPVPVNAVALSGGGAPDTATLERIANTSGGQMVTRSTLPDFIESMSASMRSQWLARAELYPEQGYRRGALLLSLQNGEPLPPGAIAFHAQRSYEPPAQGAPVLIRDFAYNDLTGNFLFNVALADYRQVVRLDVTVTDQMNNVQVLRKSQEVILPTEQISLEASRLEPDRRYLVQVIPYTPQGRPLRDGNSPVTAQHRFRYELPPAARQLQFTIDSVRVKDEPPRFDLRSFRVQDDMPELIATLQLANAHDLAQVEGYLVAEEENRQVAEFVTELLPNGTVRLPLQVDGGAYRVVLRGLDEDGAPLAADEAMFTFRPRQGVLQRAATALRQNPLLLPLAFLPLGLGLLAGWGWGRIVGRREGQRLRPTTTLQPVAAPPPGPVQLRVVESPDESVHGAGPWLLTGPSFTIGRQGNDLTISGDLHVSRNHARITRNDSGNSVRYYIEDLGSSNGTFVEGVQLVAHQPTLLDVQQETHVRIGKTTQLVVGQRPTAPAATLDETGAGEAAEGMERAPANGYSGSERSAEAT